eukprot:1176605-Prorocentrum_minimum.AAC.3
MTQLGKVAPPNTKSQREYAWRGSQSCHRGGNMLGGGANHVTGEGISLEGEIGSGGPKPLDREKRIDNRYSVAPLFPTVAYAPAPHCCSSDIATLRRLTAALVTLLRSGASLLL